MPSSPSAVPVSERLPALLQVRSGRSDTVAFSIAAIVVVAAFGFFIARTHTMTHLDLQGVKALNTLHVGVLGALGAAVYKAFSPVEAVALTAVIVAVLWAVTKNLRLAVTFAVAAGITWVSSDIVKLLVRRARPDSAAFSHHLAHHPVDPSYPSGHMVYITALALTFFFLARGHAFRPLVGAAGVIVCVVVALCLVSDGVHYPSDVLASVVWSLGVTPLVLQLWNRHLLPRINRTPSTPEAAS